MQISGTGSVPPLALEHAHRAADEGIQRRPKHDRFRTAMVAHRGWIGSELENIGHATKCKVNTGSDDSGKVGISDCDPERGLRICAHQHPRPQELRCAGSVFENKDACFEARAFTGPLSYIDFRISSLRDDSAVLWISTSLQIAAIELQVFSTIRCKTVVEIPSRLVSF